MTDPARDSAGTVELGCVSAVVSLESAVESIFSWAARRGPPRSSGSLTRRAITTDI